MASHGPSDYLAASPIALVLPVLPVLGQAEPWCNILYHLAVFPSLFHASGLEMRRHPFALASATGWSLYQMEVTGNDAPTREAAVIQLSNIRHNWGMLDIPAELLVLISAHMNHHDLRAFALASRFLCGLLLPGHLRRCGLKLKDTCTGGTCVDVYDPSGYASLGFWSTVPMFHPPEEMFCSIPYGEWEARSAIGFVTRFLLNPLNTSNLRNFHFSLWDSNPLPIMSELHKIHGLFCALPLTRLCISGCGSAAYLPPYITPRGEMSYGSHTLTSLTISSDHAFAPGLVRTTMGILKQSPIKSLAIYMVSLNPSQWSTLLGQLNMTLLEDIEVEGDIPRPVLVRFLIKHRGLRSIRMRGDVPSDRTQPSRSKNQHFLPNLRTLHAPLAICCDIIARASDPSHLYDLHVELGRLRPHDPLFLHLVDTLRRFQNLGHLGLRLVPSSPSATPQASPGGHNWDGHPVCELRQVRTLSFLWSQGVLSLGDIDMMCAYIRSFPMPEVVHAAEEGATVGAEVLESLRKANPTLRVVTTFSGSFLKWTADAS